MSTPEQHPTFDERTVSVINAAYERVKETGGLFTIANEDTKAKKKAHDAARETLEMEIGRALKRANGIEDLPLFANMNDALDAAVKDPIVDTLLQRLITSGFADLNILIVAGWTETERNMVQAYLDSVDAHAKDEADAAANANPDVTIEIRPVLELPAFLAPQVVTESSAALFDIPKDAEVVEALVTAGIEATVYQVSALSVAEQREVLTWCARVRHIKGEKGDAVTVDDLPAMPDCLNAALARPRLAPEKPKKAKRTPKAPKEPKASKAKRQTKNFTNPPRVAKAKKGKK
jgi:hypothetical protein